MAEKIDIENQSKYFFIGCVVLFLVLSVFVVKSFIIAIIGGVLLSYIFYPLYLRVKKLVRNKDIAAFLTAALVVVLVTVPLIFVANALIQESIHLFNEAKDLDLSVLEIYVPDNIKNTINLDEEIKSIVNKLSLWLAKGTSDFLVTLPKKVLDIFVILFIMFYTFKEGKDMVKKVKKHIPLKEKHKNHLAKRFNGVVYASLYGLVVTAIVQGGVGAIGLWLFDIPSPILWGMVMIILAMLPFVGAAFVWLPAVVYKLAIGDTFNGIGLLIYGVLIISTIDNIIRPKIVGSRGKIHPVLVLLGVLGGLEVFGLLGMIIGPLVLAILMVFLSLYVYDKKRK